MSRHILASVIAVTLLAGATAPAVADQRSDPRSIEVDVSRIDLTSDAGARMVMKRIERAADRICGVRSGLKSLEEVRFEKACVEDAVENTLLSIGDDPARQAALRKIREG